MAIDLAPISLPATADAEQFKDFGREILGVNPGGMSEEQMKEVHDLLHKYSVLLFRDVDVTPEQQYNLTKSFDPSSENHGHGNDFSKTPGRKLFELNAIPGVPQVKLIGNGTVYNHEGLSEAVLKHPSHTTFHKTHVSAEDTAKGITRFQRWHMDAALYDLNPPRVTTLYAKVVPQGPHQTVRYDDGTGDELEVPLAATAFVSGKTMFDILSSENKSVAVRGRVKYSPHPYAWMATAHALSTGLGIVSEGLEMPDDELPLWDEDKIKVYPMTWKNPVTGELHFQVHPCGVRELFVDPLPAVASREGALYPDGAHLTNLMYKMQRPAIAPSLVYPLDWRENDLILFHNRGLLHSVVGELKKDQIRAFHQCNLAASDEPAGPTPEDVRKYA
ncbi:Clavaminate synthase-like protein [Polyporus arcularius HHB13444]|uniref:Clavaminate synthase-like protein n=1 Tax=Polyporus arcularius HHB13444 TaxID=1314778 RepID=A0A5C3P128_9APHY|nr:Clavaminate synthase-like protein [Polyporus arcularius HHB13444]